MSLNFFKIYYLEANILIAHGKKYELKPCVKLRLPGLLRGLELCAGLCGPQPALGEGIIG